MDFNNKLLWVNRGTNAAPTSGQTSPYTLFGYDANGNMTSRERRYDGGMLRTLSFLWDGDDRLRVVNEGSTNRITASYDGDGVRASKVENWPGASLTHNYSWGPGGLVSDSNANTIYTPGFGQQANSVERYVDQDWLGSTRYLSDGANGNSFPSALRFDAFGNRSATGGTDAYDPSDLQFAGGFGYQTEFASSTEPGLGLQYLEQRYYDPAVGRFISQDPLGVSDYGYAGNDPVNGVDPSGLYSFGEWWTDFQRGSIVTSQLVYPARFILGGIGGGAAGLLALPVAGPAVAWRVSAGVGGVLTGVFSAAGNPDPKFVLGDAAAGATGAGELMSLANLGSLGWQYQFGGIEAETAGVECGASTAAAPLPMAGPPSAARLAEEEEGQTFHPNDLRSQNPTHVYAIRGPRGLFKIGESSQGVRVRDGASIRAGTQVRALRRATGEGYESEILGWFPNKAAARQFETRLIQRYTSRFGRPPGNPLDR